MTNEQGEETKTRTTRHTDIVENDDGTTKFVFFTLTVTDHEGNVVESDSSNAMTTTDRAGNVIETAEEKGGGSPDSQPTEEGTGRPSGNMHTVRCDIAGCIDLGITDHRRVNPGHAEGNGSVPAGGSGLPSWATDPCPDCNGRGSGQDDGFGYTPRDEGDGDEGRRGGGS